MLVSPVDEPLVNLIAEAESVVFNAEVCDHLKLASGENLQNEDRNNCCGSIFPTCMNRLTPRTGESVLTFPMGLLGVLMMIAFVLELNLLASSSGSRTQSALVTEFFPDF